MELRKAGGGSGSRAAVVAVAFATTTAAAIAAAASTATATSAIVTEFAALAAFAARTAALFLRALVITAAATLAATTATAATTALSVALLAGIRFGPGSGGGSLGRTAKEAFDPVEESAGFLFLLFRRSLRKCRAGGGFLRTGGRPVGARGTIRTVGRTLATAAALVIRTALAAFARLAVIPPAVGPENGTVTAAGFTCGGCGRPAAGFPVHGWLARSRRQDVELDGSGAFCLRRGRVRKGDGGRSRRGAFGGGGRNGFCRGCRDAGDRGRSGGGGVFR